ncbi:methyltransferase, FxLD system [Yinghuangia soli]|uniref:Protein-L-isoaspartate O-methyltransferase n=1 Tax=Yinghuangia soli TaxID=2908204 RepID=A0AA41Q424_9ACTN|nr:methyltransferase, FxLD system [Yinghuangia soli]MCF2531154.1 methyltransferase, FxLD system [Yinghuangia soli]
MGPDEWPQYLVEFTDWNGAEATTAARLLPVLNAATAAGDITRWSFLRKHPHWRLRYHSPHQTASAGSALLRQALDSLVTEGLATRCTPSIHEPETTAFGGPEGIEVAHDLFHHDSGAVLAHGARQRAGGANSPSLGRRELAVLLPSVLMRAARLDWYEQGDVWAKVAHQRPGPDGPRTSARQRSSVQRLMTIDAGPSSALVTSGALTHLAAWVAAFDHAGSRLAELAGRGRLGRGLRAVIAHHVIFHWNRLGLPRADQHILSTLTKEAVMGTSESHASPSTSAPVQTDADHSLGKVNTDLIDNAAPHAENLRNTLVDQLLADGHVRSSRVEHALRNVPRHLFVPQAPLEAAYANSTVDTKFDDAGAPISCASQPGIVAMMLEQLDVQPGHRVLELGAGTGYNAGLLAHLVGPEGHVTTVDVDADIVDDARAGLAAAGFDNVTVVLADGAIGHAVNAPYDRIIATVGAHGVPQAWLDQLVPDGRLLAPLRLRGSVSRSIAFEQHNGVWRSVGSEMNTFMPLRRGIADDPRTTIPLTADRTVTLVTNSDQVVDAAALADVLDHPRAQTWTGVTFRGPESAEWLELWLTCLLPNGLSRMPANKRALESGVLTNPYPSATASFDKGALTYLTRRKADQVAQDGAALHEFGVVGHGPGSDELAERVTEAIRAWDHEHRGQEVRFEIQALDAVPPSPRPGRFAFANAINRIVIEWL